MKTSLSLIVLAALALGLVAGALIRAGGSAELAQAAEIMEALGGLWLNALRMTVVPLVFALLVVGVASVQDAAATGKLAARAVALFTMLLLGAGVYGIYAAEAALALWPIPREAADAFIAGGGGAGAQIAEPPTLIAWIQGLAPANPVAAAAESAILPLVVFAIFFGFAATRLEPGLRDSIVTTFRAVSEAMVIIVRWVLYAGPFGVFALALGVGLRAGFGAAGTLVHYAAIVSIVTLGVTIVAWLLALTWGRQAIGKFTTAAAPVWAIAISTQSSLASLPAMIQAARTLGVPDRVIDLVLPLAVAIFRFTSPVANLAVCMIVAHLYGVEPSVLQILGAIVVAYGVSIGSVGLPGQISFIASVAPISIALGVPTELLGILIAIEVIPDIFRTLGNVTGDLAVTTILSAGDKRTPPARDVGAWSQSS